jgi:toxin ParE1/3/4
MKPIYVTASARADISRMADHTKTEWGEDQWRAYRGIIENTFGALSLMPRIGRRREDLATGLRSVLSGQHVIFYREAEKMIEILRIYHAHEDIEHKFSSADE